VWRGPKPDDLRPQPDRPTIFVRREMVQPSLQHGVQRTSSRGAMQHNFREPAVREARPSSWRSTTSDMPDPPRGPSEVKRPATTISGRRLTIKSRIFWC